MNEHTATEALDAEVARVDLLDLNRRDVQRLLAAADNAIEEACADDGGTLDDATLILGRAIIEWLSIGDFAELVNARRGVNLLRRISLDATACE